MKTQHFSTVTALAKKLLFIIIIICACDLVVHGQVIYVSNTGDDNNAGTEDAPVFSIRKAAEIIKSNNNDIRNSIIFGATQSGVWNADADKDFVFENNIVSDCKYAWIKNSYNTTKYSINNCIFVNNEHNQGIFGNEVVPREFDIEENNVIKEGTIALRPKDEVTHNPLPIDYLHIMPDTLGYDMGAGLFKTRTNGKQR